MKLFNAAFGVEFRKTAAARVTLATTAFLVVGIVAIATGMTMAARSGNAEVIAKLGPVANLPGWEGLIAIVVQVTAAAGVLAFGVVLSWMFGREFADGTVSGLFALPVPRGTIAAAKLLVYLVWTVAVAAVLVALVGLVGAVLNLDAPDSEVGPLLRLATLTILSALIATPTAWAATIGRGVLPGIATTIGIVVVAQISAVAGQGAWFPFTAPALWAIKPGSVTHVQLSLVAIVPIVSGIVTFRAWSRLQLDR